MIFILLGSLRAFSLAWQRTSTMAILPSASVLPTLTNHKLGSIGSIGPMRPYLSLTPALLVIISSAT